MPVSTMHLTKCFRTRFSYHQFLPKKPSKSELTRKLGLGIALYTISRRIAIAIETRYFGFLAGSRAMKLVGDSVEHSGSRLLFMPVHHVDFKTRGASFHFNDNCAPNQRCHTAWPEGVRLSFRLTDESEGRPLLRAWVTTHLIS